MKEHSLFLRLGFRAEDTQLIQEANQFYRIFERIEQMAHSLSNQTDPEQIRKFNSEVQQAATGIFAFKRKVLGLILIEATISNGSAFRSISGSKSCVCRITSGLQENCA